MAGRITKSEEQLRPDPRYHSKVLSRFINCIMLDGRKTAAERVVYDAMDEIRAHPSVGTAVLTHEPNDLGAVADRGRGRGRRFPRGPRCGEERKAEADASERA